MTPRHRPARPARRLWRVIFNDGETCERWATSEASARLQACMILKRKVTEITGSYERFTT